VWTNWRGLYRQFPGVTGVLASSIEHESIRVSQTNLVWPIQCHMPDPFWLLNVGLHTRVRLSNAICESTENYYLSWRVIHELEIEIQHHDRKLTSMCRHDDTDFTNQFLGKCSIMHIPNWIFPCDNGDKEYAAKFRNRMSQVMHWWLFYCRLRPFLTS
jgi:hypothetical protein